MVECSFQYNCILPLNWIMQDIKLSMRLSSRVNKSFKDKLVFMEVLLSMILFFDDEPFERRSVYYCKQNTSFFSWGIVHFVRLISLCL